MDSISGDAIRLVRTARGWTQQQLAEKSGVPQATISKAESGMVVLDDVRGRQIADAVGVPPSLLTSALGREPESHCTFHRKRSSTSVGQARWARANLAIARLRVEALFNLIGQPPSSIQRQTPTDDGFLSVEDIARDTRKLLSTDEGPIADLVAAIEGVGVAVIAAPLGSDRLDAISEWPVNGWPVVLVNASVPGERQRFTAAHELGHAVMHTAVEATLSSLAAAELPGRDDDLEREADRFAAELLFPMASARRELAGFTVSALPQLKQRWRLSRSMIIRRARDVGALSDNQYRRVITEMSAAGWRTREPDPLPMEVPTMLARHLADARGRFGDAAVATAVHSDPTALDEVFVP